MLSRICFVVLLIQLAVCQGTFALPQDVVRAPPTKDDPSGADAHGPSKGPQADPVRRAAVLDAFKYNYGKYEQYAFGKDILDVVAKTGGIDTSVHDFAGTIIDGLDTMLIMGMGNTPQYKRALDVVSKLNFNSTEDNSGGEKGVVKVFEWTIRLVGGLLAAYERNGEKQEDYFLVEQAERICMKLSVAWENKNKIPFKHVNINKNSIYHEPGKSHFVSLADAGTLTIEWATLSKYTKKTKYRKLVEGSVNAIIATKPVFPGIWDEDIYPSNNSAALNYVTLGGGYDSFFEYLLKYPVLLGAGLDHPYIKAWETGMDSIVRTLLRKTGVNNFTFLADYSVTDKQPKYIFSHLACFIGGNIAYGGRLLKRNDWTQIGLEITESCGASYAATALKLGPYGFGYADAKGEYTGWDYVSASRRQFYNKHGLFVTVGYWLQAPEVLESLFHAYRITGDKKWQDMAWDIFNTVKKHTDSGEGWAPIVNVNDPSSDILHQQQTFLYAETLKYLYLIFDDPENISLDEYVFNTEGHLFKRLTGGSPASVWGKVQGTFPYTFVTGSNAAESTLPPSLPTKTQQPQHIFDFKPGSSKLEATKSLASLLHINNDAAAPMHSGLPKRNHGGSR